MVTACRTWSVSATIVVAVATLLLSGCALIQPPPMPHTPRFALWGGSGDASCAADVARAHSALAAAGAAAGDPAATAAAHAAAAGAMASYHGCLARNRP